jgi:hypothetical protein
VKRKKCVQKEFDRADIVRDVRLPDLPGLGTQIDAIICPAMVSHSTDDLKQTTRSGSGTRCLYTALAALVLFVAIDTCQREIALSLHVFVGPLLSVSTIFLAIYAAVSRKNRRRCLRQLATLAIFWAVLTASFFLNYTYPIGIRSAARWLIWSHDYKAEVLARPEPPNGELRNIEWDEGGMFAQNWSAFLVFDPTDSLAGPARSLRSCKLNGIPCSEVELVHRMDSHWYVVFFPY